MNEEIKIQQDKAVENWGSFWKVMFYVLVVFACFSSISLRIDSTTQTTGEDYTSYSNSSCNVQGILIRGYIDTYGAYSSSEDEDENDSTATSADDVLYTIQTAQEDDNIQAILVEIDSYGGNPVAAEEIATALKQGNKKSYAHIRSAGVSSAYWIATGTDKIYASKNSDIGGIGITMSYLDSSEYNKREGYSYQQISSGRFKDNGNPDAPLSEEGKNILQRDVDIMAENFIQEVSNNRAIDIEIVKQLADGSTMLGEAALDARLIDEIGVIPQVHKSIESDLQEDISICWN